MIKFENTQVMNLEGAIRGMRNPLNSWDMSDSWKCHEDCHHALNDTEDVRCDNGECGYCIGMKDMELMRRLIKAGSDHRKFMRQIMVSVDITAPLYWWKEFDTYKVGTVSNSCSTMHKIHSKPFTMDDFSREYLFMGSLGLLSDIIDQLNGYRDLYLQTKDKSYWWQLIQLLPSSYNQRRTLTLNYEVLYNTYTSRKNHKLDEWRIGFMEWIESLPYAMELIIDRS